MDRKIEYATIAEDAYTNTHFSAGLVEGSKHDCNTIYLSFGNDTIYELSDDEALAIIRVLSHALASNTKRVKPTLDLKWKTREELIERWKANEDRAKEWKNK